MWNNTCTLHYSAKIFLQGLLVIGLNVTYRPTFMDHYAFDMMLNVSFCFAKLMSWSYWFFVWITIIFINVGLFTVMSFNWIIPENTCRKSMASVLRCTCVNVYTQSGWVLRPAWICVNHVRSVRMRWHVNQGVGYMYTFCHISPFYTCLQIMAVLQMCYKSNRST